MRGPAEVWKYDVIARGSQLRKGGERATSNAIRALEIESTALGGMCA